MDRRTTIKWVLAAGAAWSPVGTHAGRADPVTRADPAPAAGGPIPRGYGTDPNLVVNHRPGELWPLTFTAAERRPAGILADVIIPADEHSASASAVGVVDFIDEWVSAPYPRHRADRTTVLDGLAWLDAEAGRRFGKGFGDLDSTSLRGICDDICDASRAAPAHSDAAEFFALFRDLTAGAFYSTPAGRKDLNYIGNVPLASFDGPPAELIKALGLE
jgi:hypothetical protein